MTFFEQSYAICSGGDGVVTFERRSIATAPNWSKSALLFSDLSVDDKGTIEDDGDGMIQVLFRRLHLDTSSS